MSNLPQFMPEGKPMEAINAGIASGNAAQSWMNQAQEREIRAQRALQQEAAAERAQQEFQIMLPAIVAKSQVDQAVAPNLVANAVAEQKFRKDALDEMPIVTTQYTEALKIADYSARADALAALQAKSSWLGQVPESKGLADAINNARARAEHEAQLDAKLKNDRYVADQTSDRVKYGADLRWAASVSASAARVKALESARDNAGGHDQTAINTALIREYGEAATRNEVVAEQQRLFNPEQADAMITNAKDLRAKMEKLAAQSLAPQTSPPGTGGPSAAPSPAAKAVPIEKKPYVIDTKAGTFAFTDPKLKPEGQRTVIKAAIDAGDITKEQGLAILLAHDWGHPKAKP
jgi:hypothetical protein